MSFFTIQAQDESRFVWDIVLVIEYLWSQTRKWSVSVKEPFFKYFCNFRDLACLFDWDFDKFLIMLIICHSVFTFELGLIDLLGIQILGLFSLGGINMLELFYSGVANMLIFRIEIFFSFNEFQGRKRCISVIGWLLRIFKWYLDFFSLFIRSIETLIVIFEDPSFKLW